MAKQACTPTRVFGPFDHHLFLGCSITSVSSSIGWNEQIGELNVDLVQDSCSAPSDHPKVYYDENLIRRTTTDADPGFTFPIIGSPAYFRLGDFEFAGLVQSYEETSNEAGNPTYQVKLIDPRQILEGTQLIIGDYAGSIYGTPNVLNVYGLLESFGRRCPLRQVLGAYFGSPAGAFGGAQLNDNGLRWNLIKDATSLLTSAIPSFAGQFSEYGRLVFRGSDNPGYGSMKPDIIDVNIPLSFPNQTPYQAFYFVDLSEIPNAPAYYRIAGTSISLLECISKVCEDAGCDYYVELVPIRLGNTILKIIKVRVVARGSQPILGSIASFVEDAGNVVSKTVGRELRNETTSQFIIGGQVDSIFQADEARLQAIGALDDDEDIIKPFWGLDEDGNIIPTEYDENGKLKFEIDLTSLNALLYEPLDIESAILTEYELQAALTGQEAWMCIASATPTDLGRAMNVPGILDAKRILDVLNKVVFPHHLIAPGAKAGPEGDVDFDEELDHESKRLKDVETIYNFVLNYARDYYGKKYIVRVPYTCARIDDESRRTFSTESPTDSGWTEHPTVIGLRNPAFMDLFKEDNGKILPFVRFDNAKDSLEITTPSEEDYLLIEASVDGEDTSQLFLKADIGFPDFVYENYNIRFNPHVVIDLAVPILERLEDEDFHRVKKFAHKFFELARDAAESLGEPVDDIPEPEMGDILERAGNSLLHLGIESTFKKPDAAAVPIRNNVLSYGPWIAKGPPGLTRVERDEGLVPWEYGSVANMNTAGNDRVIQGVTYMQVGEMGSVTIPGYPALPLGAELRSGGFSVLENRNVTSNKFEETVTTSVTMPRPTKIPNPAQTTTAPVPRDFIYKKVPKRHFKGKWDATSGVAPSPNPKEGDYYIISKDGTTSVDGTANWLVNDIIVFSEGRWEQRTDINAIFMSTTEGLWIGTFGPNITGITVDIGEGGIQTTYTMRTYTPKFGRFSKNNADRLAEYALLINRVQKHARLVALQELKIQLNRQRSQARIMSNRLGNPLSHFAASPPGVLVGQIVANEDQDKSTAVHLMKHTELTTELKGYEDKAFMSLDGLLRPISKSGSGDLPRFSNYSQACLRGLPVRPEPPLESYSGTTINQESLDPWQEGHDIDILGRGDEVPPNLSIPLDDYADDYRGFALKGPILLTQPGFDLQGKPIPNAVDTVSATSQGNFKANGLRDTFLTDYLKKPDTWPVAPIDLRYDRNRGVWVSPQPYRMVKAVLVEDLTTAGVDATVTDGNAVENAAGTAAEKTIKVYAISDKQIASAGDTILAEYDTVSCKYWVVEVPSTANLVGINGPFFIGKCRGASVNLSERHYDSVKVVTCSDLNGTETVPSVTHNVRLLKHHVTSSGKQSNFHTHDLRNGDIILYMAVPELVGSQLLTNYVCVSEYSREYSILMGKAMGDSLQGFPEFHCEIKKGNGDTDQVKVKNKMRHPVKKGMCCFLYRHKDLPNNTGETEYWLIQAEFAPVCVVSDVKVSVINTTDDACVEYNGGEKDTFRTSDIKFEITDKTLYSEAAWTVNSTASDSTYLEGNSKLDIDIRVACCSDQDQDGMADVTNLTSYQLCMDFGAMAVTNTCSTNTDDWRHSDMLESSQSCSLEGITFHDQD